MIWQTWTIFIYNAQPWILISQDSRNQPLNNTLFLYTPHSFNGQLEHHKVNHHFGWDARCCHHQDMYQESDKDMLWGWQQVRQYFITMTQYIQIYLLHEVFISLLATISQQIFTAHLAYNVHKSYRRTSKRNILQNLSTRSWPEWQLHQSDKPSMVHVITIDWLVQVNRLYYCVYASWL